MVAQKEFAFEKNLLRHFGSARCCIRWHNLLGQPAGQQRLTQHSPTIAEVEVAAAERTSGGEAHKALVLSALLFELAGWKSWIGRLANYLSEQQEQFSLVCLSDNIRK